MTGPALGAAAIQEIQAVIHEMDRESQRSPVAEADAPAVLLRLVDELLPRWCDGLRAALIPPAPRRTPR